MDTDRLAALIAERHKLLARLRAAAARQLAAVRSGEMPALLAALADKQGLVDELARLEQDLQPFRDDDPEERVWRSAADRSRCAEVWQGSKSLLLEILQDEREAESELSRRRDGVAQQLSGHHRAAEARRAYLTGGSVAAPAGVIQGVMQVEG